MFIFFLFCFGCCRVMRWRCGESVGVIHESRCFYEQQRQRRVSARAAASSRCSAAILARALSAARPLTISPRLCCAIQRPRTVSGCQLVWVLIETEARARRRTDTMTCTHSSRYPQPARRALIVVVSNEPHEKFSVSAVTLRPAERA